MFERSSKNGKRFLIHSSVKSVKIPRIKCCLAVLSASTIESVSFLLKTIYLKCKNSSIFFAPWLASSCRESDLYEKMLILNNKSPSKHITYSNISTYLYELSILTKNSEKKAKVSLIKRIPMGKTRRIRRQTRGMKLTARQTRVTRVTRMTRPTRVTRESDESNVRVKGSSRTTKVTRKTRMTRVTRATRVTRVTRESDERTTKVMRETRMTRVTRESDERTTKVTRKTRKTRNATKRYLNSLK